MNFPDGIDAISRRRFLSLLSASAALAAASGCSTIDRGKIVPYTRRPGERVMGTASYYASCFQEGIAVQSVLVKTREGRPIHIEGNNDYAVSHGKASLRAVGDLLGLYDPDRLSSPLHKGNPASWDEALASLTRALSDTRIMEKQVLLLTGALLSPTQEALLYDMRLALPGLRHIAWEPAAPYMEIAASKALYGKALIPRYYLNRADAILSLQSDFLGLDPNAPAMIDGFAARRKVANPADHMNRLWAIEGTMTLTGSNADHRLPAPPSKMAEIGFALAARLHQAHARPLPHGVSSEDLHSFDLGSAARNSGIPESVINLLADDLAKAGRSALVLAGAELPSETHVAARLLNYMLGAEGNTVAINSRDSFPALASMAELKGILEEAAQGKFAVGIFWGANPGYAFPDTVLWKRAVKSIPESYRIGLHRDETALDCSWSLPEHHWLESWGDFKSDDFISLRQPTVGPIHDSMQAEEALLQSLRGMKVSIARNYYEYLKTRWQSSVYQAGNVVPFEPFWSAALHNGGVKRPSAQSAQPPLNPDAIKVAIASAKASANKTPAGYELVLSPGAGVYDGRYANNGWLNELPDPVTKTAWSNPMLLSMADAQKLGIQNGDMLRISSSVCSIEAPAFIQPGQAPGVASLALGYGRRTGTVATGIGSNAYSLIDAAAASSFLLQGIAIVRSATGLNREIPQTQRHDRMEGRDLARSWTMAEYVHKAAEQKNPNDPRHAASLIPALKFEKQKWSMVIDLSACVGCSACVIACQSENNIPIVGPERLLKGREMHWIRIDRYYEGAMSSPSIRRQPMLCQHCDNAPCEIVCPVNATTHSPDGLNQMTYNRCIGTRYCSNNCPFKVRRFNFFDYTSMKKAPETFVYNPEVTVRPRGVMEKCTFCIQRIQNAKQNAKLESRPIKDGEAMPACAAACPSGAITFGDVHDPDSQVSKLLKSNRKYKVLEELGIKPSITYLADISNPADAKDKA